MESLAQPIAVIAMFAAERGSQRVAFRLEHQGLTFIVIQRLEKSRGTAVCRNGCCGSSPPPCLLFFS